MIHLSKFYDSTNHNSYVIKQKIIASLKYLGILIDEHLKWSIHLDYISSLIKRLFLNLNHCNIF